MLQKRRDTVGELISVLTEGAKGLYEAGFSALNRETRVLASGTSLR